MNNTKELYKYLTVFSPRLNANLTLQMLGRINEEAQGLVNGIELMDTGENAESLLWIHPHLKESCCPLDSKFQKDQWLLQ